MEDQDVMVDMVDTSSDIDNCPLFKNNLEYIWIGFMQASKILEESMIIYFTKPDFAPIQKHSSYKIVDNMKSLLTELVYDK